MSWGFKGAKPLKAGAGQKVYWGPLTNWFRGGVGGNAPHLKKPPRGVGPRPTSKKTILGGSYEGGTPSYQNLTTGCGAGPYSSKSNCRSGLNTDLLGPILAGAGFCGAGFCGAGGIGDIKRGEWLASVDDNESVKANESVPDRWDTGALGDTPDESGLMGWCGVNGSVGESRRRRAGCGVIWASRYPPSPWWMSWVSADLPGPDRLSSTVRMPPVTPRTKSEGIGSRDWA